ncbi:hypothetical protein LCGC14_1684720 [marine sediment metagenome]|uniref:Uncharacterized protein n=1 Tax=marine sediment metagenome TaxID=412755 RepID=A0A0F9IA41_9ZZZZ
MKKLMVVLMLLFGCAYSVHAAVSKTSAVVDEWAAVAENTIRDGAATTISDSAVTTVTVSVAATGADAGEGMYIIIQTSMKASGDDDWTTMSGGKILVLVGTANLETITNNPAAIGTTVFTVADDAGYELAGMLLIFIEDQDDVTDSELMYAVSTVTDTSITVLSPSTTAHANTAVLSNLVYKQTFSVPSTAHRVKVVYDNTFDDDGTAPEIHSKATVDEMTL